MAAPLNNLIYRSGGNADLIFARSKPTYINAAALIASVETILTVPVGANCCIFSADGDFYARADATAVIPSANIIDGSAAELNPAQWDVHDITTLHVIAPDITILTLSFYK